MQIACLGAGGVTLGVMTKGSVAACVLLGVGYVACGASDAASDGAAGAGIAAGASAAGAATSGAAGSLAGAAPQGGAAGVAGVAMAGSSGMSEPGGAGGVSGGAGGSAGASAGAGAGGAPVASPLPAKTEILATLRKANDAWMAAHANPGDNLWARAVYFIGDTEFAKISGRDAETEYAAKWSQSHNYGLNGGNATVSADNQCAGQTYLALTATTADAAKTGNIQTCLSAMVKNKTVNSWWWIDALFMAMPSFVALGVRNNDPAYFNEMWTLYNYTKRTEGGGLWSEADGLWWRDKGYKPPHLEPNGKSTFWSRGNGWVFAAHARVLESLPADDAHRAEYLSTFQAMAVKLKSVQRPDGFWNASLLDPTHFGGPETSGTGLYTYGFALGVAHGWLDRATYEPSIDKAYRALVSTAMKADGTLGYIQGVGSAPESSQPVGPNSNADFGVGAFLLGGSAVYALSPN